MPFIPEKMKQLALGLMSGTSGDGVSLSLAEFQSRRFKLAAYQTFPYSKTLGKKILRGPRLTAAELSRLNMELGNFFAEKILKFLASEHIASSKVAVVGSHGQTIYHGPLDDPPNTFQIGEASVIAEQTGIAVVADFRMRDLAAGGEGAPLIPFFDDYFFGRGPVRLMQNIGGIANVSAVGRAAPQIGFDTGPGNCLIDLAVRQGTKGRLAFDAGGKMAARGVVHQKIVREMASHPYFTRRPPKSTGREFFNEKFFPAALRKIKFEDRIATLTFLTALTIAEAYRRFISVSYSEVVVSGGGALNLTLMKHLADLLKPVPVVSIEKWNIPAQAKEPLAFSFFALEALKGKRNHLPRATGARRAAVLGKIIPGRNRAAD